jgi:hypothetical protein
MARSPSIRVRATAFAGAEGRISQRTVCSQNAR